MTNLTDFTASPPCLQKILLRFEGYDIVISFHPRKEMRLVDGLSRPPPPKKREKEIIDFDIKIDFVQFSSETLTQIYQATNVDLSMYELRDLIL